VNLSSSVVYTNTIDGSAIGSSPQGGELAYGCFCRRPAFPRSARFTPFFLRRHRHGRGYEQTGDWRRKGRRASSCVNRARVRCPRRAAAGWRDAGSAFCRGPRQPARADERSALRAHTSNARRSGVVIASSGVRALAHERPALGQRFVTASRRPSARRRSGRRTSDGWCRTGRRASGPRVVTLFDQFVLISEKPGLVVIAPTFAVTA